VWKVSRAGDRRAGGASVKENQIEQESKIEMSGIEKNAKWGVLDGGHVVYLDHMGSDHEIVEAARVSYQAGTKHTSDQGTLLRYLMRHRHSTPFEMAEVKMAVRVPMDTWRQWVRHRTANINEYSTRYSEAIDDFAMTEPTGWRTQAEQNRQGSGEFLQDMELGKQLSDREQQFLSSARNVYQERLACGVAREQARKDLPLSTYTEAIWKIDLHNLLHFLSLRMDHHAQREIRQYANVIGRDIVARLFPETWEAFLDYRLFAMQLSSTDIGVIEAVMSIHREVGDSGVPPRSSWMEQMPDRWKGTRCRERDEFFAKIERLGLVEE
jgi:thymidylate synthase (FAD)